MSQGQQKGYRKLDRWALVKLLGSGGYADVYLGYDCANSTFAAVKVIRHSSRRECDFQSEAVLHSNFYHEHIIDIKSFHQSLVLQELDNTSQATPTIVMEYAKGGDLLSLVKNLGSLSETIGRTYFTQLLGAIEYIHGKGYCHQDIKLENILLDENYCIKLGDFGCAKKLEPKKHLKRTFGTALYFTPEMNLRQPFSPSQADIFAAAIVAFTTVIGHRPFERATKDNQFYSLIHEKDFKEFWRAHGTVSERLAGNRDINAVSNDFKNLMVKMLSFDPQERLNLEQIKKDKWLRGEILTREQLAFEISKLLVEKGIELQKSEDISFLATNGFETAPAANVVSS